jgi:hypothetical protein
LATLSVRAKCCRRARPTKQCPRCSRLFRKRAIEEKRDGAARVITAPSSFIRSFSCPSSPKSPKFWVPEVLVPLNPRTVGRRTNIDPCDLAFGRQKFVSTGHKAYLFAFLLGDAPYAPISNITVAKPGATCWAKRIGSQAGLCRVSLTGDPAARIAAPSAVSPNALAWVSYQSSV